MTNSLQGRYALITGGGSGIGKAIASRFVNEGAHVLICGRTASILEATANEINSLFCEVDVSNSDSIKDLADFIIVSPRITLKKAKLKKKLIENKHKIITDLDLFYLFYKPFKTIC